MIDITYILITIIWVVVAIGFYKKDYAITAIPSFFMMAFGVYVIINGMAGINNWLTSTFAVIHIALGFYIVIRGGYEMYKD